MSENTYTENDIRNLLEICSKNGQILVNSSFDSIISKINTKIIDDVKILDDFSNFINGKINCIW